MQMRALILVALTGGLGSVARYSLSTWIMRTLGEARLPVGTLAVNVIGCLAAGALAGLAAKHDVFSVETRTWVFAGLLGGFTTFSAFGLETLTLLKRGDAMAALMNVFLSILLGLLAVWLGWTLFSRVSS